MKAIELLVKMGSGLPYKETVSGPRLIKEELIPIKYQYGKYNGSDTVYIELRDVDRWAITNGGSCLNTEFEWEFEGLPSGRTDDFKTRTRFTLNEAKRILAEAIAKGVFIK